MNIFVFGFGNSSRAHIKSLLTFSYIDHIYIFTESDPLFIHERCTSFSRRSFLEISRRIPCHLVLIASATCAHVTDYQLVKDLDVPVIFEKPITQSYEKSFKFIVEHGGKNNQYIFFQRRMAPHIQAIKTLIDSTMMGEIKSVSVQISKYKSKEGPAYLSHLGIHYIDLLLYLLTVQSYSLASFFPDQAIGSEKRASVAGSLNDDIPFVLLLDCEAKFASSPHIVLQFDFARLYISDLSISLKFDPRLKELPKMANLSFINNTSVDLLSYSNYWRHVFSNDEKLSAEFSSLPTLSDSLDAEKFLHNCYKNKI